MDGLILCILTRVRALSAYIGILAIHALTTTGNHLCKQADTLPSVLLSNNKQEIQCNEELCLSAMNMFSPRCLLEQVKRTRLWLDSKAVSVSLSLQRQRQLLCLSWISWKGSRDGPFLPTDQQVLFNCNNPHLLDHGQVHELCQGDPFTAWFPLTHHRPALLLALTLTLTESPLTCAQHAHSSQVLSVHATVVVYIRIWLVQKHKVHFIGYISFSLCELKSEAWSMIIQLSWLSFPIIIVSVEASYLIILQHHSSSSLLSVLI